MNEWERVRNDLNALLAVVRGMPGGMQILGDVQRVVSGTEYDGGIPVFLDTPLTSTDWDNDTKAPDTYSIDTVTTFGAPAGAKSVTIFISGTWAAASGASYASVRPTGGTSSYGRITALTTDAQATQCQVPLDADGKFDIVVAGANMTASVLRILGYTI